MAQELGIIYEKIKKVSYVNDLTCRHAKIVKAHLLSKEHIVDNIVALDKRLVKRNGSFPSRATFFVPFEEKHKAINVPCGGKELQHDMSST